jgi:uncharacterized membrane protein YjfL (UPF0719 family)
MFKNWRLSSCNGALLAAYFIPAWSLISFHIMMSPVRGLFERPNISVARFVSDTLQLSGMGTVRVAWLLALARLTVAAFFAIFVVLVSLPRVRRAGSGNEALAIALGLGSLISFASMLMASHAHEVEALRLHATELMLLLGTAIVLLVEAPAQDAGGVSTVTREPRAIDQRALPAQ